MPLLGPVPPVGGTGILSFLHKGKAAFGGEAAVLPFHVGDAEPLPFPGRRRSRLRRWEHILPLARRGIAPQADDCRNQLPIPELEPRKRLAGDNRDALEHQPEQQRLPAAAVLRR